MARSPSCWGWKSYRASTYSRDIGGGTGLAPLEGSFIIISLKQPSEITLDSLRKSSSFLILFKERLIADCDIVCWLLLFFYVVIAALTSFKIVLKVLLL